MQKILQLKFNKKLFATGLVEVIVVLAILATTMVSIVIVTTRGLRQVKRDEIEDRAVGLQLRSLELAKSPATLTLPIKLQTGDIKNYYLQFPDASNAQGEVHPIEAVKSGDLTLDNCSLNSEYHVVLENTAKGEMYCNQMRIELKSASGKNYYEVKSIIVYKSINGFEKKELLAYRRE